eukprot:scaffold268224_cov26-Tisochrysis_lutea.AAC.1
MNAPPAARPCGNGGNGGTTENGQTGMGGGEFAQERGGASKPRVLLHRRQNVKRLTPRPRWGDGDEEIRIREYGCWCWGLQLAATAKYGCIWRPAKYIAKKFEAFRLPPKTRFKRKRRRQVQMYLAGGQVAN